MTITFIGSGSGITSLKRFHTSLLLGDEAQSSLIDCGDGVSRALLNAGINYNSINSIFITHLHPDHFSGLFTLLVNMGLTGRTEPLTILIHEGAVDFLDNCFTTMNLDGIRKRFDVVIKGFTDNETVTVSKGIDILPRKNSHILNKYDSPQEELYYSASLLITSGKKHVLYTSDIGSPDDLHLFNDKHIDYLITETTHIDFDEIIKVVGEIKPRHTYLVHVNDKDEFIIKKSLINYQSGPKISLSFDGLKISL